MDTRQKIHDRGVLIAAGGMVLEVAPKALEGVGGEDLEEGEEFGLFHVSRYL
jgi:hypothetical protein